MERKKLGNCLGCKPINRKRLGKLPWLLRVLGELGKLDNLGKLGKLR